METKEQHTPGPWIRDVDNEIIFGDLDKDEAICEVFWRKDRSGIPMPHEANACLIASAPDLLKAAEAVIPFYERVFQDMLLTGLTETESMDHADSLSMLEDAINKARKETQ